MESKSKNIMFIGPVDMRLGPGIKNISTINHLKKEYNVVVLNTYLQGKIKGLTNIIRFIFSRKNTIIAVSTGGRKIMLPLAFLKKKLFPNYKYAIITINGYIIKEFSTKNKIKNYLILHGLINAEKVFVEVEGLKKDLNSQFNMNNVVYFPNFKEDEDFINFEDTINSNNIGSDLKCAFLARVTKVKGIDIAVQAVKELNDKGKKIYLDIYGPIDDDASELIKEIDKSQFINYKGNIENHLVTNKLKDYNLFLFPTRHKREGFPASIIDAYSAALPVIASDISYNSEIVIDNINGSICKYDSIESLKENILKYLNDKELIQLIAKNNFEKVQFYRSSIVFNKFMNEIKNMGW